MENLDKVSKIVQYIRNSDIENKSTYFENRYANFKKNYPILFNAACADYDDSIFCFMMQRLKEIKEGLKTKEDVDVEVGKHLFDTYVEPIKHLMEKKD